MPLKPEIIFPLLFPQHDLPQRNHKALSTDGRGKGNPSVHTTHPAPLTD